MPINANFIRARAFEQRNRLMTHLALPAPFRLQLRDGRAFLVPQVHYTERHRMELLVAENPIVHGDSHFTANALFQVLWRLHPLFYRRGDDTFPNRRGPSGLLTCLRSWWAYRRLIWAVQRSHLITAELALRERLALSDQDKPGAEAGPASSHISASPPVNTWDDLADYYARTWHIQPTEVFDYPRALLWQLHRNRILAEDEDAELKVFAPSDSLL